MNDTRPFPAPSMEAAGYTVNRRYRDSLFRLVFQDKMSLLSLYNALNQSDYRDPEELVSYTIDDAIYIRQKNDISFLIGNRELMKRCRKLEEYAIFVGKIRERTAAGLPLREAVDKTTDECIQRNILKNFLVKHRGEVREMVLTTFDQESYERITKEYGKQQGIQTGKIQKTLELICKKLRRGKTLEQIAEEMETELESIRPIFQAAEEFAPEYDAEKIYQKMYP